MVVAVGRPFSIGGMKMKSEGLGRKARRDCRIETGNEEFYRKRHRNV
jgi:hypothetical protein